MKARFFALAALVLGMVSCQQDVDTIAPVGGEVDFQISVAAPELAGTRAGEDGEADTQNAMDSAFGAIDYLQGAATGDYRQDWGDVDLRYTLEVYDVADSYAGAVPVKDRQVVIVDEYAPVVFDLRLVPNRDYHFVVFADFVAEGSASKTPAEQLLVNGIRHEIGTTLADITVFNEAINDEVADSYFATKDIKVTNSAAQDIVLKRPYGKLRVVATDLAELNLNVHPKSVVVEYESFNPNKFDAVTGDIDGEYAVKSFTTTFVENVRDNMGSHYYNVGYDAETAPAVNGTVRNTHITLFTDYILGENAQTDGTYPQTPIHFTMTVNDGKGGEIKTTAFTTDIPVERNKLTTVIGNVLTTATEIEVRIDDNFAGEYVQSSWDGKAKEPQKDAEGNWVITEASELAWLADQVNGTTRAAGRTFEGETFKLTKDIDLNNDRWTPIGATGKFLGTFDGQNHKITNLFVSETDKTPVGLFSNARNIKNVKVIGAEIYGHYKAGVIVGDGLCAKIENCHVENAIVKIVPLNEDDANHAGGIVGYLSGEPVAYVKGSSVKNAEIFAFRDVAGIAGCANSAAEVSGNTVENVTVTADQTVKYVSNEKDGNAAAVAGRLSDKAVVKDNNVGAEVVVIRKVDTTKEMEYAVADAQNGDTIYVGNGEVALPHFESKALNFVGEHANAAIAEPVSSHIDAFWQGAELNFADLKIKGTSYTGKANGYVKSAKETYTNCKFVDGYYMFAGDVVMVNNSVFTGKYNSYFWTGSADEITFNKCKFNAVERAVKVCTVGHTGVEREVNFNECEFTATELKKAALEIDGSKGSSYIVNINDCTETGFAKGEFTDLAMFNVEGAENVEVYLDGVKWVRNGVMEENGELFAYNAAGLQYLLDNAVDGETVKIGADIEGDVTVTQKADVKIAIEGYDHKYAGVITVDGKSATYKSAGVTIKNLNFEADAISADACIRLGNGTNATRYACNVAVEGCTFNVPGVVAVKSYTGGDKNLSIKDCTGTGLHSLLQVKNIEGITIEGVNITGGRGASFGQSSNIVVKNSTFVAESYGLRSDASVEATLAIENVNITAKLPVVARKTSKNYTINFAGENNLVTGGYQVVFTTGDDEATFVAPAEYTITGADSFKVFPRDAETNNFVYNVDEFKKALEAKKTNIILQPGEYEGEFTINYDNVTIKGDEATIKGRVEAINATAKFEGIKFDFNDSSVKEFSSNIVGNPKGHPAIVGVYGGTADAVTFERCEFICKSGYSTALAPGAITHYGGIKLTLNECTIDCEGNPIYAKTNIEMTGCTVKMYGNNAVLSLNYSNEGRTVIFKNNIVENKSTNGAKTYGMQFLSTNGKAYKDMYFDVQGNTVDVLFSRGSSYTFANATYANGSATL